MKKIIISLIALVTVIILGFFIYLLIFGATKPSSNDVFTEFSVGDDREVSSETTDDTQVTSSSTVVSHALKQLTTKPVAGATFVTGNGKPNIQYIEQGTGHMYQIDLQSDTEKIVSGTTITQATDAIFSQDASYVAITSLTPKGTVTTVGKHNTATGGSIDGVTLPEGAHEVSFSTASNTVLYVLNTETGSSGYSYHLLNKINTEIFKIPLQNIHVLWGTPLYVYTTPTGMEDGYLYKVIENELTYVGPSGKSLLGFRYDDGVILTKTSDKNTSSIAYTTDGSEIPQAIPYIPEKCTRKSKTVAYCATPSNRKNETFPDDWYKGVLSYSDVLWTVNIASGKAGPLSDFKAESGREIDVHKIGTDASGEYIWFINKNDNTLWMFDTTK